MTLTVIEKCMSGRRWDFYGDSLLRELFNFVILKLKLNASQVVSDEPMDAYSDDHQIQLHYEFHDVPIHHNTWLNTSLIRPVSVYLDSIPSDVDIVILISIGVHFAHVPHWFFRRRIKAVFQAAERLHQRNPRSIVILKSPNTREHEDMLRCLVSSDWSARRMTEILREMVSENPYIGYIDTWSTSKAQLANDSIHPVGRHTAILFQSLISLVC